MSIIVFLPKQQTNLGLTTTQVVEKWQFIFPFAFKVGNLYDFVKS